MTTKLWMSAALLAMLTLIVWSIRKRDQSAASPLNLDDLLLGEDGKLSKAAAVLMGSFSLTSWVVVYLTLQGKLDTTLFAAYMAAWVVPSVTRLIVNRPQQPPASTNIAQATTAGAIAVAEAPVVTASKP